jgi:glutathione S-transferase
VWCFERITKTASCQPPASAKISREQDLFESRRENSFVATIFILDTPHESRQSYENTEKMVLQVYLDPCTVNSRKVLAGLGLIGAEYNFNHVNYFTQEHKKPEYLKINPMGTVPSAIDGDVTIVESNAIMMYAADVTKNISAYPTDLKKRAQVNSWLLWEASVWFQSCYVYLVEYVVKPLLHDTPDESVIAGEAPRWHQLAGVLNSQLAKTKFLVGDEPTIADIAVASAVHLHQAQKLPLDQHPQLQRWIGEIEKLPCWKETQKAVDKALLPGAA